MTATSLVPSRLIFLLIVFAVVTPRFALSQEPQAKQDNSFLLQLKDTKFELPALSSTTCMAVLPDGRFHLEHSSVASILDISRFETFEDVLSEKNSKSLLAILSADDFKSLKALPMTRGATRTSHGQLIWSIIPRGGETQTFLLL